MCIIINIMFLVGILITFFVFRSKKMIKAEIIIGSIGILVVALTIPILINELYKIGLKTDSGYVTLWEAKDALAFYGSFLSFVGTVALGMLALWQNQKFKIENDKAQDRLEKMNKKILELDDSKEKERIFEKYFSYLDDTNDLFDLAYIIGNFEQNKGIDIIDTFYRVKKCQAKLLAKKRRLLFLNRENSEDEYFKYIESKVDEMIKIVSTRDKDSKKVGSALFEFWKENSEEHNMKSLEFILRIYKSIYKS